MSRVSWFTIPYSPFLLPSVGPSPPGPDSCGPCLPISHPSFDVDRGWELGSGLCAVTDFVHGVEEEFIREGERETDGREAKECGSIEE